MPWKRSTHNSRVSSLRNWRLRRPEDFQAIADAREEERAAREEFERITSGSVPAHLMAEEEARRRLGQARHKRKIAESTVDDARTKIAAALAIAYRVTRKIFLLANQVPLMSLHLAAGPSVVTKNRCFNATDEKTVEFRERSRPFSERVHDTVSTYLWNELVEKDSGIDPEVVRELLIGVNLRFDEWYRNPTTIAISDPNDVLSYPIPLCEGPNGLFGHAVINVTTNIERMIQIPGLFVWPVTAHTGHLDDGFVRDLLVCGGKKGNPGSARAC